MCGCPAGQIVQTNVYNTAERALMSIIFKQLRRSSPGGGSDGENLPGAARTQRIGTAAEGGPGGSHIVNKKYGECNLLFREESTREITGTLPRTKSNLALFPAVPPDQQLAAWQRKFLRERFSEQAAVIDGSVPAAGLRHSDPCDNGTGRKGYFFRQGKEQVRQNPGGTGFRTVFEPDNQTARNPFMRAERPCRQIRCGIGALPGKERAVVLKGFTADGTKTAAV